MFLEFSKGDSQMGGNSGPSVMVLETEDDIRTLLTLIFSTNHPDINVEIFSNEDDLLKRFQVLCEANEPPKIIITELFINGGSNCTFRSGQQLIKSLYDSHNQFCSIDSFPFVVFYCSHLPTQFVALLQSLFSQDQYEWVTKPDLDKLFNILIDKLQKCFSADHVFV